MRIGDWSSDVCSSDLTMTTAREPEDLVRFLEAERHAPLMRDFEPASNNLNSRADLPSDAKAAIYAVEPAGPGRRGPRATAAQTSSRRKERHYGTDYWRPGWRRPWQCGAGRRRRHQRQKPADLHPGRQDRKSTSLTSSHQGATRMQSSAS